MAEPDRPNGHPHGAPVLPSPELSQGQPAPAAPARSIGTPLDPGLLAESTPPASAPVPWRAVALFFIPAAAVAGGRGLQWLLEGPEPGGDHLARWLLYSAAAGLLIGALAGTLLTKTLGGRLVWACWGVVSPLVLALSVTLGATAARPFRDWRASVGEAKCRKTRTLCQTREFRAACAEAGRPLPQTRERALQVLGPPVFERCDGAGCTLRWSYAGPWTPDDWVAPGSILCSVVTDAAGQGVRSTVQPGDEPRD